MFYINQFHYICICICFLLFSDSRVTFISMCWRELKILLKNLLTERALRFPGVLNVHNCFDESEQAHWSKFIQTHVSHTYMNMYISKKKEERDFYLKYNCFFSKGVHQNMSYKKKSNIIFEIILKWHIYTYCKKYVKTCTLINIRPMDLGKLVKQQSTIGLTISLSFVQTVAYRNQHCISVVTSTN